MSRESLNGGSERPLYEAVKGKPGLLWSLKTVEVTRRAADWLWNQPEREGGGERESMCQSARLAGKQTSLDKLEIPLHQI